MFSVGPSVRCPTRVADADRARQTARCDNLICRLRSLDLRHGGGSAGLPSKRGHTSRIIAAVFQTPQRLDEVVGDRMPFPKIPTIPHIVSGDPRVRTARSRRTIPLGHRIVAATRTRCRQLLDGSAGLTQASPNLGTCDPYEPYGDARTKFRTKEVHHVFEGHHSLLAVAGAILLSSTASRPGSQERRPSALRSWRSASSVRKVRSRSATTCIVRRCPMDTGRRPRSRMAPNIRRSLAAR